MGEERTRELLEKLLNVIADQFDVDGAIHFMKVAGFTNQEIMELEYGDTQDD